VTVDGGHAGWIGELHPVVCGTWDIEAAAAFEIDLAALVAASRYGEEAYDDVISYPAVHEDLAVVVAENVSADRVRSIVLDAGGELLRSAEVFDVYRGEQVAEDRKSLALRLEFRAADRTLTDEEVAERRAAITEALGAIGGSLRE
jgi:phenylalanyl-tRNA synthetase beta chain